MTHGRPPPSLRSTMRMTFVHFSSSLMRPPCKRNSGTSIMRAVGGAAIRVGIRTAAASITWQSEISASRLIYFATLQIRSVPSRRRPVLRNILVNVAVERIMRIRLMVPMLLLVALGIVGHARGADERAAEAKREVAAIRKAAADYLEALKRGDAAALVAAWTAEGDYADSNGSVFKACDLIKKQFPAGAVARDAESSEIVHPQSTIRLISDKVAIEDGAFQVRSGGEAEAAAGRYTVVWKKEKGRWLIDGVREASAPAADEPSNADARLTELAWLVGDWVASSGKTTYEMSAQMLEEDRVLELSFTVLVDNRRVVRGVEFITREPDTGEIKSCFIDSRGGHGEGVWLSNDKIWTVDTTGALADGTRMESTTVYTPRSDGSLSWCVLDARLGDEDVPEVSVQFSRKRAK
jgi:ketosteroid isomerase-like protein